LGADLKDMLAGGFVPEMKSKSNTGVGAMLVRMKDVRCANGYHRVVSNGKGALVRAKSIASHLKPYSILKKRRTTIAHAFASALAPTDVYDEDKVITALRALRQDPDNLRCVYCFEPAQTWDHLFNLVKNGESNGHGHQIGNLVPCCRHCNSAKGGKTFEAYIDSLVPFDLKRRAALKALLHAHAQLTKTSDSRPSLRERILLKKYREIQDHVLSLLREADTCASEIRAERQLRRWRNRESE
jgi:5-methylcytosine-specific restriction endonuclease McrA